MKVIEGGFDKKDDGWHMGDYLVKSIEEVGINETEEGDFILLVDTGEQMRFLSSFTTEADVVYTLEKARSVMMSLALQGAGVIK